MVAELALGRVLVGQLPRPIYPDALKRSASTRWQRQAEMTLDYADAAYASRGDVIGVVGAAAQRHGVSLAATSLLIPGVRGFVVIGR